MTRPGLAVANAASARAGSRPRREPRDLLRVHAGEQEHVAARARRGRAGLPVRWPTSTPPSSAPRGRRSRRRVSQIASQRAGRIDAIERPSGASARRRSTCRVVPVPARRGARAIVTAIDVVSPPPAPRRRRGDRRGVDDAVGVRRRRPAVRSGRSRAGRTADRRRRTDRAGPATRCRRASGRSRRARASRRAPPAGDRRRCSVPSASTR